MNKQLQYYLDTKINPVDIKKNNNGCIAQTHINSRFNLFNNHLKIATPLLKNKEILEFGPCGGENAILLAKAGANITLVEPNFNIHEVIKSNFESENQTENLRTIYSETIENFEDDKLYDLVVAEGFLHALPDRAKAINKLKEHSNGLVMFTYSCTYGYFFEALKRYVFKISNELDASEKNIYKNAEILFKEEFDNLNTSRSFESWIHDILINPVTTASSLDNFDELYKKISLDDYRYYSGSPSFDNQHMHKWYKNITDDDIISSWHKNLSFFITGNVDINFSQNELDAIKPLTAYMLNYSCDIKSNTLDETIDKFSCVKHPLLVDVLNILKASQSKKIEEIRKIYSNSEIKKIWGMPQHHIVLIKEDI